MKCIIKDCENHSHEGKFNDSLCSPCHTFLSGEGGLYSQAYRNVRSMIDLAVAAEREACAQLADEHAPYWAGYKIAKAIRERVEK